MNDFFEKIKEYFNNFKELYRKPIREIEYFWANFKRSTKWFYRMWNNQDWDHDYLVEMILFKLKDMRYQFDMIDKKFVDLRRQPSDFYTGESDEELLNVDKLIGLDKAIEIGERIIKQDYIKYTPEIQEWFDAVDNFNNIPMPENLRKELMEIYRVALEQEKNDRKEFFNLIRDNHELWWT